MSVHILILLFTSLFLKSADYLICIKIWVSGFALLLRCEDGDTGQQMALNQAKTIPCKNDRGLWEEKTFPETELSKKVDIVYSNMSDVNLFQIACLKSSATKPSFKF